MSKISSADEELIGKFDKIRSWKRGEQRAVNKPLLILLALSRLAVANATSKETLSKSGLAFRDIEKPLSALLRDFGPYRQSYHPEYPFWRLQNDGIWTVKSDFPMTNRESNTDAKKSELLEKNAIGWFTPDVLSLFDRHPEKIEFIAYMLLNAHFSESIQSDLLDAIPLSFVDSLQRQSSEQVLRTQLARDPQFRRDVLQAYGYRCAVCGYELRLGNELVGVEAAHIRWVQAKGPDTTDNGIAMCSLHHKLFDRGAFTISPKSLVVVCSKELIDRSASTYLHHFHGKQISLPGDRQDLPSSHFLEWHDNEVFRKPGLPIS